MSDYTINMTEFTYNKIKDACLVRDELLKGEYPDPNAANNQIRKLACAWDKRADVKVQLIQHHPGQSVVFFSTGYIEYSRNANTWEGA